MLGSPREGMAPLFRTVQWLTQGLIYIVVAGQAGGGHGTSLLGCPVTQHNQITNIILILDVLQILQYTMYYRQTIFIRLILILACNRRCVLFEYICVM